MDKTHTFTTNATLLASFSKNNVKDKMMVLDVVKDHIIPHVSGKKYDYEMWEAVMKLYQSDNHNRKRY